MTRWYDAPARQPASATHGSGGARCRSANSGARREVLGRNSHQAPRAISGYMPQGASLDLVFSHARLGPAQAASSSPSAHNVVAAANWAEAWYRQAVAWNLNWNKLRRLQHRLRPGATTAHGLLPSRVSPSAGGGSASGLRRVSPCQLFRRGGAGYLPSMLEQRSVIRTCADRREYVMGGAAAGAGVACADLRALQAISWDYRTCAGGSPGYN